MDITLFTSGFHLNPDLMPRKEKQERGTTIAAPLSRQQHAADTRAAEAEARAATYKARGDAKQRAKAEKADP